MDPNETNSSAASATTPCSRLRVNTCTCCNADCHADAAALRRKLEVATDMFRKIIRIAGDCSDSWEMLARIETVVDEAVQKLSAEKRLCGGTPKIKI